MKEKKSKKNNSVKRVFKIIEAMADSSRWMRLRDISLKSNLPQSTVLRLLNTLFYCDYVIQDQGTTKYSLSLKFCQLANQINAKFNIRDILKPFLVELSEKFKESSCLAIEDNMEVTYIDTVEGPDRILQTMQRIGKKAPMHCTGVGKILLLNYTEEDLKKFIKFKKLEKLTTNTITNLDKLIIELKKVKSQNYAVDNEECELGARCIAVPVIDYSKKIVAAISVSGPSNRLTLEKINYLKSDMLGISVNASQAMGF